MYAYKQFRLSKSYFKMIDLQIRFDNFFINQNFIEIV